MATQQQNHHTQQLDVATQKHWLLQTPKELVADFNTKKGENLAVLKISIYLFQGDHVLLFHQRDRPYPGEQEEWIVPHDIVRVDRPASHPTQQAVATIPIRIRTLHYLASMRVPIPLLHEIQFMEFSKPEPLSIHSGETLHIWAILTLYPHPLPPETREAFLTTLNNNAVYRWATEADVNQNRIKTPAFDTDITRSDQLHILDLKAAFKRLSLCCKFNITHVPPLASLSTTGHHILASVLEARAMRYAGDAGRYGMILLSNTSPRNLIVNRLRETQMDTTSWPAEVRGNSGEVYTIVGAFKMGRVVWRAGAGEGRGVLWGEVVEEGGRVRVSWVGQ